MSLILLVDDNEDDVDLTLRAFARTSPATEVAVARDGREALEFLSNACVKAKTDPDAMPRLVLLDLNLPGISGLEVLRRLRADPRTRRLPVVILSSSTHLNDLAATYDSGANSYVRKPTGFEQFVDTARQIDQYWMTVNQPPHYATLCD
jgi:two-component system response regulator